MNKKREEPQVCLNEKETNGHSVCTAQDFLLLVTSFLKVFSTSVVSEQTRQLNMIDNRKAIGIVQKIQVVTYLMICCGLLIAVLIMGKFLIDYH